MDRPEEKREVFTQNEAADYARVCSKTIWNVTAPRGDLRPVRIGRSVRYLKTEIDRWLQSQLTQV